MLVHIGLAIDGCCCCRMATSSSNNERPCDTFFQDTVIVHLQAHLSRYLTFNFLIEPVYNRQRQLLQCKKLLAELLTDVDDYAACFKRFSSGIVLGICYGMSLQEAEDQFPSVLRNNESMGSDVRNCLHIVVFILTCCLTTAGFWCSTC